MVKTMKVRTPVIVRASIIRCDELTQLPKVSVAYRVGGVNSCQQGRRHLAVRGDGGGDSSCKFLRRRACVRAGRKHVRNK